MKDDSKFDCGHIQSDVEIERILQATHRAGGNRTPAAQHFGMDTGSTLSQLDIFDNTQESQGVRSVPHGMVQLNIKKSTILWNTAIRLHFSTISEVRALRGCRVKTYAWYSTTAGNHTAGKCTISSSHGSYSFLTALVLKQRFLQWEQLTHNSPRLGW